MGIGIGLIVGVAALNIVASLILLVMEKTRDIAILKTMGASARSVMLIFLIQGLVIGTVGTIVGASVGAPGGRDPRSLSPDQHPGRRLSGHVSAVPRPAAGTSSSSSSAPLSSASSRRSIPRVRRRSSIPRRRCAMSRAARFARSRARLREQGSLAPLGAGLALRRSRKVAALGRTLAPCPRAARALQRRCSRTGEASVCRSSPQRR